MNTHRTYEAPEDFVNACLAQLDKEIRQLRMALICAFTVLFSVGIGLLI